MFKAKLQSKSLNGFRDDQCSCSFEIIPHTRNFSANRMDSCWQSGKKEVPVNDGYVISTDKARLDVPAIHDYLSNRPYWGQGRTIETVRKSIENSLCFGIYDKYNLFGGKHGSL
jgi:hypothetical protein